MSEEKTVYDVPEIIKPIPITVGRKVCFVPDKYSALNKGSNTYMDATVVGVHSLHEVNLVVFDFNGNLWPCRSVFFVQPGEKTPLGEYAHWMPYQVGQAEKAKALQEKLDDRDSSAKDAKEPERVSEAEETGPSTTLGHKL